MRRALSAPARLRRDSPSWFEPAGIRAGGRLDSCIALGWPAAEATPPRVRVEAVRWTEYRTAAGELRPLALVRAVDEEDGAPLEATRHLGGGAEGDVMLYVTARGGAVALKTLAADWTEEDVDGARLWSALALHKPALAALMVPVRVLRPAKGDVCMCMPAADGSLESLVPLAAGDAFRVAAVVAEALAALLAGGVCYCDLKPENVLLARRRGLVHLVFGDHGGLARAGARGIATYPPPECASGRSVVADGRCARWAAGVLAITLTRGHDRALLFGDDPSAELRIRTAAFGWVTRFGGRSTLAGEALRRCFFGSYDVRDVAATLRRAGETYYRPADWR